MKTKNLVQALAQPEVLSCFLTELAGREISVDPLKIEVADLCDSIFRPDVEAAAGNDVFKIIVERCGLSIGRELQAYSCHFNQIVGNLHIVLLSSDKTLGGSVLLSCAANCRQHRRGR